MKPRATDDLFGVTQPNYRFRPFFYYWKWVNILGVMVTCFSYWFFGLTTVQTFVIIGLISLEHIILYCFREYEDSQWDKYDEVISKKLKEKRTNA